MTAKQCRDALVEVESAFDFEETLARLEKLIAAAGLRIFSKIDHAQGAREIGSDMPPTVLVIYGHPAGGTPIMLEEPLAGLDLPLRALVHVNSEGRTMIAFRHVAEILAPFGVAPALANRLAPAQALLLRAAQA
jgi:uncharacterized protein (DUF302 family)